jgi:hypothetical protein
MTLSQMPRVVDLSANDPAPAAAAAAEVDATSEDARVKAVIPGRKTWRPRATTPAFQLSQRLTLLTTLQDRGRYLRERLTTVTAGTTPSSFPSTLRV